VADDEDKITISIEGEGRSARVLKQLHPDFYKADMELLDRYTAFSTEVARLSLLALAALGGAFSLVVKDGQAAKQVIGNYSLCDPLPVGIVLLLFATAAALAHRYFAADGVAHYVDALRRLQASPGAGKGNEYLGRSKDRYRFSGRLLALAVIALAVGVVFLTIGVVQLLRTYP
jgi:hypothetical protein